MRKILFLCLALSGCSTLSMLNGTTISPQQVIIAANGFDVVEATATNYIKLPICPAGAPVCRTKAATAAIIPAVRTGRDARNQLEAFVNANPGQPAPVSLYNAVMTAITTLQALLAQYHTGA